MAKPEVEDDASLLAERCDRCGARAAHRVELANGELYFCRHHMREHGPALVDKVRVPRSL